MSTEIIHAEEQAGQIASISESATILQVIQRAAADPACDIEKMERLMAMHERMQARNAETEFNANMAAMQCEIPAIVERGKISVNDSVRSYYAKLEDIVETVRPIMKTYGFAVSFRIETTERGVAVTGILMHRSGHREQTTMLLPHDTSGSKNVVQGMGSSVSYGKRYVLCALLNITTKDEDDDGTAAQQQPVVTKFQAKQLAELLPKCSEKAREAFSKLHGTPEQVTRVEFDSVLARLKKSASRPAGDSNADHP